MALTTQQKKDLTANSHLSWVFRSLMSEKERQYRNIARKLFKDNDAGNVVHQPTIDAKKQAALFTRFNEAHSAKLDNANGNEKLILVSILADFDYSNVTTETVIDTEVIDQMALETYSPSEGVNLNIFELIIDQSFEEFGQKVKDS